MGGENEKRARFDVLSCSQGIRSRFDLPGCGQKPHPLPHRANIRFKNKQIALDPRSRSSTRSSSYSEERRKSGSVLRKISRRPDVDAPAIAILLLSLSLSFSLSLCPFFNPFSVEILFFLRDRNQLGIRNSKIS